MNIHSHLDQAAKHSTAELFGDPVDRLEQFILWNCDQISSGYEGLLHTETGVRMLEQQVAGMIQSWICIIGPSWTSDHSARMRTMWKTLEGCVADRLAKINTWRKP